MGRERESGVVLIVALWSLILFSALVTMAAWNARQVVVSASLVAARAKNEALADAGINLAIFHLLSRDFRNAEEIRGRPIGFDIDGVSLKVRIQDESGKLNLLLGEEATVRAVLSETLPPNEQSSNGLAEILAWREAKRASKVAQGNFSSQKVPFLDMDELRSLSGIDPSTLGRLQNVFTLYSRQSLVAGRVPDPLRDVLQETLLGSTNSARSPAMVAVTNSVPGPSEHAQSSGLAGVVGSGLYSIVASVVSENGQSFGRSVIVQIDYRDGGRFRFFRWDERPKVHP